MPKAKRKRKPCENCNLRNQRIQVLEQLVGLHQQEMARRRAFETQAEVLVSQANALQQQLEAVKSDGNSAERNGATEQG